MNPKHVIQAPPAYYDRTTIRLHWITAVLIVLLWVGAQLIDSFPKGPLRVDARSFHMMLGVILAMVIGYRIWWRVGAGHKLPPVTSGSLQALASAGHVALYALIVIQIVLGLANAWVRGDNIFNLFIIPAYDPANKALRHQVEDLHSLVGNIIIITAGVHALIALIHHYVLRDNVLRRMLPGR